MLREWSQQLNDLMYSSAIAVLHVTAALLIQLTNLMYWLEIDAAGDFLCGLTYDFLTFIDEKLIIGVPHEDI